jgi:NADPH:quinone reductase-like Zn-dependent oxidoreductase
MKAAFLDPQGRTFTKDIGAPGAGPGDVVIQVAMTALHHGNLLGAGERPLGIEAVGVVTEAAPGSDLTAGQRVGLFPAWGAVRDVIALPRTHVFPLDERVPNEAAAQLFVNPLTAFLVVRAVERALAEAGSAGPVVVSGAASAVGRIILAETLDRGRDVVAVTRRATSAQRVEAEHGVRALATQDHDWAAGLGEALGGRRPAVAADAHGGRDAMTLFRMLAERGSLIHYGDLSGQPYSLTASDLLGTNPAIRGLSVLRWMTDETAEQRAADVARAQRLALTQPGLFPVAGRYTLTSLDPAVRRIKEASGDGTVIIDLTPGSPE